MISITITPYLFASHLSGGMWCKEFSKVRCPYADIIARSPATKSPARVDIPLAYHFGAMRLVSPGTGHPEMIFPHPVRRQTGYCSLRCIELKSMKNCIYLCIRTSSTKRIQLGYSVVFAPLMHNEHVI